MTDDVQGVEKGEMGIRTSSFNIHKSTTSMKRSIAPALIRMAFAQSLRGEEEFGFGGLDAHLMW